MKPYTIFYNYNGKIYQDIWEADTWEEAILDAKYQLEDCKHGYTVLKDMTRKLKENQY